MFDLLLITSWSVWIGKFHEIFVELFSVTCTGSCWYHGMYFLKNPCSSSKRTWMHLPTLSWLLILFCRWKNITTRYDVVDGFFFDTGVPHVSSSSTLKTCFLMCLMEIACSWMATFVDYVDLSRVEDLIHWLDHSLSTWGWWRYVENCPCTFSFEFHCQFVDACRFDGEFLRQFPHGSCYHGKFRHNIRCHLVDRFFLSGYLPVRFYLRELSMSLKDKYWNWLSRSCGGWCCW